MPLRADDPALRMPHEPYPGLRPFLDHEAPLLQGRKRQIEEVRKRLHDSKFVAVVGGSGCGKSSLIRAGVVPDLRGKGLPGFGSYWVPVVFTPGTAVPDAQAPAQPTTSSSPLTRLAWKFCKELAPLADAEADADRHRQVCDLLRRGGFRRLVDALHGELPQRGPKTETACFLFVVDQFEELFHRNNQGSEDARLIVEAVISHFFDPHPRCAVIITMRSENLADCAAYLELPDAINRSMYLVRRLDNPELRAAIVGPASFYLRMRNRAGEEGLPDEVRFDEAVVQRLLDDVEAISHDADHLPLLQHVLARMWEAACDREGRPPDGVAHAVTWADLERACLPEELREHVPAMPPSVGPADGINSLRLSLEHWASLRYHRSESGNARSETDRQVLDALLRRLGYRDPDSGVYLQDRFELGQASLVAPGDWDALERVRALVDDGFLNEVNYLYWDAEDPRRETLKVSHEAFIRGWSHFRDLLNTEAERFEEFKLVYRRCLDWSAQKRQHEALLSGADLGRIDSHNLDRVIERPKERATWVARLSRSRNGERLAQADGVVKRYLNASRKAWRAAQAQRTLSRRRKRNVIIGGLALGWLVLAFFLISMTQEPAIRSVDRYAAARIKAERAGELDQQYGRDHVSVETLDVLLQAAQGVARARQAEGSIAGAFIAGIFKRSPDLPLVGAAARLPYLADSQSYVNGMLRQHLTTSLWRSDGGEAKPEFMPKVDKGRPCQIVLDNGKVEVKGALVTEAVQPSGDNETLRRLFIPDPALSKDRRIQGTLSLHFASVDEQGKCEAGPSFWSLDRSLDPTLILDARLRYLGLTVNEPRHPSDGARAQGSASASPTVPAKVLESFEIVWKRGWANGHAGFVNAGLRPRKQIHDSVVGLTLNQEFKHLPIVALGEDSVLDKHIRILPTWREAGGYGMKAGDQRWRLLDDNAQRLPDPGPDADWDPLTGPPGDEHHPCARLQKALNERQPESVKESVSSQVFAWGVQCLEVRRLPQPVNTDDSLDKQGRPAPKRDVFTVALYDEPNFAALQYAGAAVPGPIAALTYFEGRRRRQSSEVETWKVGRQGRYKGWVSIWEKRSDQTGDARPVVWAAPMTTEALASLGQEFCRAWRTEVERRAAKPAGVAPPASPPPKLKCAAGSP